MLVSQSKSAMMGEMIGIIAHQFKQPLSVLSMIASNQIISVEFEEKISNEEIKKSAGEVQNQVQYLSETIDIFRSFFES